MRELEAFELSYLLNSMWQIPVLFAAGWLAARILKRVSSAAEHRVWVSVLCTQSLLPACSALPSEWIQKLWNLAMHKPGGGEAHIAVIVGAGTPLGVRSLSPELLQTIAILYGTACLYFLIRFIWNCLGLANLRQQATGVALAGDAERCWMQCSTRIGIAGVAVAASSRVSSPLTMGMFRKLVLLPEGLLAGLSEPDLRTVIAHEFAHIQRSDFLKNLIYELLSLPVSYHPLFWFTRDKVIESREMICDQLAAELHGRHEYARSLLRLASLLVEGLPVRIPHTLGIFDANTLERRLMRLTEKKHELQGVRRLGAVVVCALIGAGTCSWALALDMHVDAASVGAGVGQSSDPDSTAVPAKVMAGNLLSKVAPKYPDDAKKARIQGTVVLTAIIGKDGTVEQLAVVSGPKELQQSSLDAVRQWVYKPFLVNGEPVVVKTTVNIIYQLAK
ncbi:MAG: M56 family metallopeptidase [Terracidiphilus sp.]